MLKDAGRAVVCKRSATLQCDILSDMINFIDKIIRKFLTS